MGKIPLSILEEIKTEIENSPGKIIYVERLAERYGVNMKDLGAKFKFEFGYSIKKCSEISKLNYLGKMIFKERDKNRTATEYSYALGYSDGTGVHHLLRRNGGGRGYKAFRNRVLSGNMENASGKDPESFQEEIQE